MPIYLHPNVNFDSRNKSLYPYETEDNPNKMATSGAHFKDQIKEKKI